MIDFISFAFPLPTRNRNFQGEGRAAPGEHRAGTHPANTDCKEDKEPRRVKDERLPHHGYPFAGSDVRSKALLCGGQYKAGYI